MSGHIQSATNQTAGAASSQTCNYASSQTAGNLNVVCVNYDSSGAATLVQSVTDAQGNKYTRGGTTNVDATGQCNQEIWYCPSIGSHAAGNTVTVTLNGNCGAGTFGGLEVFVGEYNAFGSLYVMAAGAGSSGGTSNGILTSAVQLPATTLLAVAFSTVAHVGTAGTGWNSRQVNGTFADVLEDLVFTAGGSTQGTAQQNLSGSWGILMAVFAPSGGAGLPVQPRAHGSPPGAPLPGIVRLGTGVLSQSSVGVSIANIYPGGFLEGDGVLGAFAPAPSVLPAGLQSEAYLGAWAASFAGVASPILAQQRAPGFPLAAPMPGIAQLGRGLLVSTTSTVSVSLVYPGGFLEGDGLFGAAVPAASVLPSGSFTEERYGASAAASAVLPGGLDTRDAHGAAAPAPSVLPGGLQSPSDLGAIVDAASVLPGGLFTEERSGAQSPAPSVLSAGFLTLEVFGAGVPVPSVLPAGQLTLEAFGAMTEATVIAIQPASVDTQERFGSPASGPTVLPAGFLTLEVFGAGVPAPVLLPAGASTLEFFGAVTEATVIAIQPSGLETLERFGATAWVPSLLPAGFDTPLAFGASAPTPSVLPAGTFTFEAYGAQTLSQVVGLQPASAASEERFGATYASSRVLPSAMDVSEQLGAYVAGPNFYAASLSTAETFGATIVAVGVSIQPASLETYERFGSTYVTVGIQPSSVTIGEPFGVPTFSQSLALSGLDPFDRIGAMVAAQIVGFPVYGSGIDSWETFGSLGAFKRLVPVVILQPSRVVYPVLAPTWPSRQP